MSLTLQWYTMLAMLAVGAGMGIGFDFARELKIQWRLPGAVVALLDLLYWLLSFIFAFSTLLWINGGILRWHIFPAMGLGFLLYLLLLSRLLRPVLAWLLGGLRRTWLWGIHFVYKALVRPVHLLLVQLGRWLHLVGRWLSATTGRWFQAKGGFGSRFSNLFFRRKKKDKK